MTAYADFLQHSDCLLLLVDIQQSMLELCTDAERTKKNAAALIEIARIFDLPVIFSEHNAEKLGGTLPALLQQAPEAVVLNKITFSCFENEELRGAVAATGRKTILLAGLEAHVCIFHTGALGLKSDYRIHVAADAVCSRSPLNWEIGLRRLEKAGAVISSTEMIIFELLNRAATPEFRQALPLIKTL